MFYSFNPRMIPDEVFSKPVFRVLAPRDPSDQPVIEVKEKKERKPKMEVIKKAVQKRKSVSCKNSP